MHTKPGQISNSKQHEHYIKIKCKTKARGRKQSKLKKREGKFEEKKNEQKLKGDIVKWRKAATEKGNCYEDDELLSSNSRNIRKYYLRRRQQSKKDIRETVKPKKNKASNHLDNKADVNNINQCKYGDQNGNQNYDHFCIIKIIISFVICNTRSTEIISQLWFIKYIIITAIQLLYREKDSYVGCK